MLRCLDGKKEGFKELTGGLFPSTEVLKAFVLGDKAQGQGDMRETELPQQCPLSLLSLSQREYYWAHLWPSALYSGRASPSRVTLVILLNKAASRLESQSHQVKAERETCMRSQTHQV